MFIVPPIKDHPSFKATIWLLSGQSLVKEFSALTLINRTDIMPDKVSHIKPAHVGHFELTCVHMYTVLQNDPHMENAVNCWNESNFPSTIVTKFTKHCECPNKCHVQYKKKSPVQGKWVFYKPGAIIRMFTVLVYKQLMEGKD